MSTISDTENKSIHWPSALQLTFTLLALLAMLSLGSLLAFSGLFGLLFQGLGSAEALVSLMSAFAFFTASVVLFYSAYFAFQRISRTPIRWLWLESIPRKLLRRPAWLMVLLLAIGAIVSQSEMLSLIGLAPIHSLTVTVMFLALFLLLSRGIELGNRQRVSGVFASGLVLGPLIALVLELLIGFAVLLLLGIYLGTQSAYTQLIDNFAQLDIGRLTELELMEMIRPLGDDPLVLGLGIFFVALLVPLIEELIKPIGFYFSLNRDWSPASGFALGALSGAGFALFENLSLAVGSADWLPIVSARIGTSSMHMLTSGLVGWAIASARKDRRYWRIPWAYLAAVVLHGFWNGLAVMVGFSAIFAESTLFSISPGLSIGMLIGLLILAIGSIFLLRFNRRKLLATG